MMLVQYGPENLDEEFKPQNQHILSQKRLEGVMLFGNHILF